MSPLQKDALTYAGAGVAGALLAHSFQAKLLGMLIGGTGGLALAAWWISRPHAQAAGESPLAQQWINGLRRAGIHVQEYRPHNPHGWTPRDPGPGWWDHYTFNGDRWAMNDPGYSQQPYSGYDSL